MSTLLGAAKADDAMATALLAKHNPVLEAALGGARTDTKVEVLAEAIVSVLASRGHHPLPGERERILGERDPSRLERWLAHVVTCTSLAELLAIS